MFSLAERQTLKITHKSYVGKDEREVMDGDGEMPLVGVPAKDRGRNLLRAIFSVGPYKV